MRNRSGPSRVTVKSHSIPPRGLSICVYVTRPVSRATRFAHRPSRKSAAPWPETLELRERRLVEQRGRLAAGAVLGADRGRPELPGPATRPERLVACGRVRLEPVRALPARTSRRTRRRARGAAGWPTRRAAGARPRARDPGTSRRSTSRRSPSCGPACTRGERYAAPKRRESMCQTSSDGVPSTIHSATSFPIPPAPASPCAQKPAATQKPRTSVGPRTNSPSGVNASGPLISSDDPHLLERRHTDDRVLHQLLEARPVLLEQLAVEVGGDAVERPGRAVPLVAAHDQPARLGPEVDEQRRVAHRRHVERQPRRLEDEVLVRHRDHRDRHAGERADLTREHPARVDDDVRLDLAPIGLDAGHSAALRRGSPSPGCPC